MVPLADCFNDYQIIRLLTNLNGLTDYKGVWFTRALGRIDPLKSGSVDSEIGLTDYYQVLSAGPQLFGSPELCQAVLTLRLD